MVDFPVPCLIHHSKSSKHELDTKGDLKKCNDIWNKYRIHIWELCWRAGGDAPPLAALMKVINHPWLRSLCSGDKGKHNYLTLRGCHWALGYSLCIIFFFYFSCSFVLSLYGRHNCCQGRGCFFVSLSFNWSEEQSVIINYFWANTQVIEHKCVITPFSAQGWYFIRMRAVTFQIHVWFFKFKYISYLLNMSICYWILFLFLWKQMSFPFVGLWVWIE